MSFEVTRPLLAGKGDLMSVRYPVAVTPKIDGIRCLILDGVPVSRTLKPIRNLRIRERLSGIPYLLDGELIARDGNFQQSTTAVMAADSTIPWEYWVFDYLDQSSDTPSPYSTRMMQLRELYDRGVLPPEIHIVTPEYVYERPHLEELHRAHIADGFEGTMLRDPAGTYKCGRSTIREGILLKLKNFVDTEAKIIGFEELMHNDNEAVVNALGLTERSSHKENQRASGTLGAFVVQSLEDPELTYKVGTGLTAEQRADFWERQDELTGQLIKIKYFDYGIKEAPRHPVFLGFRHPDDM